MQSTVTTNSKRLKVDKQEVERRKNYLLITEEDSKNMQSNRELATANAEELIEQFYEHLLGHDETRAHLQSDTHIGNLKKVQSQYFKELFDGLYDETYIENRVAVGRTHERIGLSPQWYMGAYARYLNIMLPIILEALKDDSKVAGQRLQSLIKVIFLDMGLAIDTYIDALMEREEQLRHTFNQTLYDYAKKLSESSSGIVGATSSQTAAMQQQATAVAEVTTTLSELRQTSEQALEKAESVIAVAERSIKTSQVGSKAVEAAIQGMREIREQVEAIADKILSLSEQTQQIGEIIASVNEIAEQSKLLALNAAIEAARAGEHGKGFAVVASEIRNLADQSKQATGQVRKILNNIQAATNSAVVATEEGTKKVEIGMGLANQSGENIHALTRSIEESADAARLIANSYRQQSAGINQVADAMTSINQTTNSSVLNLRQIEEATQNLSDLTQNMNTLIDSFSQRKVKTPEYRLS
jgi:methyl-accepting chemotaxis protein